MENKGEIIVYQSDTTLQLKVRMEDETVWLTQAQMVELFQRDVSVISRHINNIFKEGELEKKSNLHFLQIANSDKPLTLYSLDVIISVGYRVKSQRGTQFRIWANKVLKDYMLKGYVMDKRIDRIEQTLSEQVDKLIIHDNMLVDHDKKIDFFIKTSLPPVEGVFYDGQLFDAYKFVADLIRTATTSLILIDNYIDDTVLTLFTKRIPGVSVTIYTAQISKQLSLDLQRHNSQYEPIDIRRFNQSHDRFLIIDEKELYHIGASLKDLGKKWFAFSKMQLDIKELLKHL
ncbi:virulence RhuM family protein [Parabacteroides sp. BX2]|mgnify:FL=1|uniref:Virulence RhuM family protein n=1 Tax=Parabacteroides segnis TaxID=2763058 RepID=A0ABR7EA62_9BACT|nr:MULTISPECIES: RhuM family protein [Parabacteroides]MBC5646660.1 virulence RhuM family protein [Parabacteroides segnis]MCM0716603.1 virulence RhuM family protein [Parabacteroides sp. TA-V-105]